MKKIVISFSMTPNDDDVTLDSLKDLLCKVGSTHFLATSEVEVVDISDIEVGKKVWVYVPNDDELPYVKVAKSGDTTGEELGDLELAALQKDGVCVSFNAEYPRADRYGAPSYATDDSFAEGIVGEHGFAVPSENGLNVWTNDRGDDGGQEIWLEIMLPA